MTCKNPYYHEPKIQIAIPLSLKKQHKTHVQRPGWISMGEITLRMKV